MKYIYYSLLFLFLLVACSSKDDKTTKETPLVDGIEYDETGCLYTEYRNLVMAGYQGWFSAEGDGDNRGWHHYQKDKRFEPGISSIDMWPETSEYTKLYPTAFKYADGSVAYTYSAYDEETIELHFKWMKEYGIDGVFLQRFISEIKSEKGKNHFNKVLKHALAAAKKYSRAVCVMYDLSGSSPSDMSILTQDWEALQAEFHLFDNKTNPTYLRHNKKPLLAIWGVGFNDNRKYSISDVQSVVSTVVGEDKKVSVMLGVPYYWRSLGKDTESNPALHELIKSVDIIMPWAVGRYNSNSYQQVSDANLKKDIEWCNANKVAYIPLVYPGFSWGNLKNDVSTYNLIPREEGAFLWKQIAGAKQAGAKSLYVAMFDEIDEGTAIYKCLNESKVPLNGGERFVGIENNLKPDHYLWLTGEAAKWFHGDNNYSASLPQRK